MTEYPMKRKPNIIKIISDCMKSENLNSTCLSFPQKLSWCPQLVFAKPQIRRRPRSERTGEVKCIKNWYIIE